MPGRARHKRLDALRAIARQEWLLAVSAATCVVFAFAGGYIDSRLGEPFWFALGFGTLFLVIGASALAVVRHADHLAAALGEPYGTLILTVSVTTIEVLSISAVMLHGENNPALVRDTLFAIVMIILGGMVGLSLLAGGYRHREQHYNLQGANAYLSVIIPLALLTLSLPNFTMTTPGPTLSRAQQVFLGVVALGLYCVFLLIQTGRHRGFFTADDGAEVHDARHDPGSPLRHALFLGLYILPVVFLAEQLAHPIDYLIETMHLPAALGGVIIALVVATPEAISAVRAAVANHLQRSINVFLGSVLSSIGLSVPIMLAVSYATAHPVQLGLNPANSFLLMVTLAVCVVSFASGRTNVLQGAVHVVLFAAFVMLIFQG